MLTEFNRFKLYALLVAVSLCACTHPPHSVNPKTPHSNQSTEFEIAATLDKGPGNITITPNGDMLVSLHQFYQHEWRVVKIEQDNTLTPFAMDANLNSVLGLQADHQNNVWLLDNAMRGGTTKRLVGINVESNRVVADIDLSKATTNQSFLNDLAVDTDNHHIYIADPAGGVDAAIVVVDLISQTARRVLQGTSSVTPQDMDLIIDHQAVSILQPDGSQIRPRIGINPIALDHNNQWLYYGPMHGKYLYRINTQSLRNPHLSTEILANKVETWSEKPICDGITIDAKNNIYLGDLANNAIGYIDANRQYHQLISDPQLSWVDAFSFGQDGDLYAVVNQLHLSAVLNRGIDATQPPYLIIRLKPLAKGTTGR